MQCNIAVIQYCYKTKMFVLLFRYYISFHSFTFEFIILITFQWLETPHPNSSNTLYGLQGGTYETRNGTERNQLGHALVKIYYVALAVPKFGDLFQLYYSI